MYPVDIYNIISQKKNRKKIKWNLHIRAVTCDFIVIWGPFASFPLSVHQFLLEPVHIFVETDSVTCYGDATKKLWKKFHFNMSHMPVNEVFCHISLVTTSPNKLVGVHTARLADYPTLLGIIVIHTYMGHDGLKKWLWKNGSYLHCGGRKVADGG